MYTSVFNSGKVGVWDKTGMAASVLCIMHCILTPLVAASLPILASTEKSTHIGLTICLMAIGLIAFIPGYRTHGRLRTLILGMSGFIMLCVAVIMPEGMASETLETTFTVLGGGFLIAAHMSNLYFCKTCSVCGGRPCRASSDVS